MLGKALFITTIFSTIVAISFFTAFTLAQSPTFEVNWYHVEQGISHQAYNISIKNPSAIVSKNFDMSVVFSNTNFDLSKILNVRISTWQNIPHQVPVSESYQEAAICQDANNNTYACQETKWKTIYQTQYWYEWAAPTSLALTNGKKNYGITNFPTKDAKWFRLEFDLPIVRNGDGWGSRGNVALFDEIDKVEYHPPFDNSFTRRKKITIESLPLTTTDYQVLLNVSHASDMRSDFGDVRFVHVNDIDGTEIEMNYYIWHKVDSKYADIFVKVPQINTTHNTTIYMYYGDPSLAANSSGQNTFELFDDFSGSSLDTTSRWTIVQGTSGNNIYLRDGNVNYSRLSGGTYGRWRSQQTFSRNHTLWGNTTFYEPASSQPAVNGFFADGDFAGIPTYRTEIGVFQDQSLTHRTIVGNTITQILSSGVNPRQYHEYRIQNYQLEDRLFINNSYTSTAGGSLHPTGSDALYISFVADGSIGVNSSTDYIFVTKSIQPEPNASFFPKEFLVNQPPNHTTPLFTSTTGKNLSTETLTCYNQNTFDADGDTVTNIFSFYKNSVSLSALNMPFESNYTLTKTADYSGHQNNATISGATFAAGKVGRALQFDGVDDYVNLFKPSSLTSLSTALTIEAWVYSNDNTGQRLIFDNCESFATEGYCLYINDNEFRFTVGKAGAPTVRATGIQTGQWYHVVATYDNTNAKIYVDGILKNTTAATGPLAQAGDEDIIIGKNSAGGDQFNGIIDELRVYPIALSPAQIISHYNLQDNKIVQEETLGGDNFICSVTPNDAKVDGTPLNSSLLTVLWNVTFNVTDSDTGGQLSSFNLNCTNGPIVTGASSPLQQGFDPGTYSCKFSNPPSYYDRTVSVVADNDRLINVVLDKKQQLTIAEHNWLEAVYNCLINGNCTLYNLVANINDTTTKTWNQFKRTDQNIVTRENIISTIVNATSNLTINYTVNIPTKEGFGVVQGLQGYDDFLPIRISYWFLDPTNTTCYNQGTKPTGVENPYCQPLTIQTVGRINTAIDFKVDLRPTLPTGTYTIVRSIEIDPLGQWIDYGQEQIGTVEVKEANNNILAKVSVPASYVAEAMKEVGGVAGPTGLFIWKFISADAFALITLTTIGILVGYVFGSRKFITRIFHSKQLESS